MACSPPRLQWSVLASSSEFPPPSSLAFLETSTVMAVCEQAWETHERRSVWGLGFDHSLPSSLGSDVTFVVRLSLTTH